MIALSRLAAIAILACAAVLALRLIGYAAGPSFAPSSFAILNPDNAAVIGHASFDVTLLAARVQIARSEAHYRDGDYDIEENRLALPSGDGLPRQLSFKHDFFSSGGARVRSDQADFVSGEASCTTYANGQPSTLSAQLKFPSDTYAGAPVMIPLRAQLMLKGSQPIQFEFFTCVPGPRLVTVHAGVSPPAPWNQAPGLLVQVDLKPDFGWLNPIIGPFLPTVRAWFDPARQWYLMGVESARYYRGPKILLVAEMPPLRPPDRGEKNLSGGLPAPDRSGTGKPQ
ncbi:MAG: hypothetical protein ABSG46_15155 [Candidatus Binataceae bacterium]